MKMAWAHWRQRAEREREERGKRKASDTLYLNTVLHKTLSQWKDNATEMRDWYVRAPNHANEDDRIFVYCLMACS